MAKIVGDKALKRKLRKLSDLRFLKPTMKQVGVHLSGKAKEYPPPREGSPYQRTRTLGKGWSFRAQNTGVTVGNAVPYAPYVQDKERQAWMHVGRWPTAQDIAENEEETVLKEIQKAVDRELAKG